MSQPIEAELVPQAGAVAVRQPQLISGVNIEALFEKAIDAKSAVEVIQQLRAMQRDDEARNARVLFDQAMKSFQTDCPVIFKSKSVKDNSGTEAYRYAPIEDVEAIIRPICQKHGFSHKFPKMILGDGSVTAFCEVRHDGGHSETAEVTYRIGTKTRLMSDTQVDASTETFAKRRALVNAYGLVLAGEDKDGGGARRKPPGPSSLHGERAPSHDDIANKRKLADLLRSVHRCQGYNLDETGKKAITQWLIDESVISDNQTIADLSGKLLAEVVAKVQTKLNKPKP